MQEPRIMMALEEVPRPKPAKKKASTKSAPSAAKKGEVEKGRAGFAGYPQSKKTSKRSLKADETSQPPFQHTDGSASESLQDSSSFGGGGGDYRGLRHKYLLLEEESMSLDRALNMAETDIKALENDKFVLLDQLVVLEGLIDPSELKSKEKL